MEWSYNTSVKNVIVGGVLLFITSDQTALVFYNAIANHQRNLQLGIFQIYKIIEYCKQNDILMLDLGVSHLPLGRHPLEPKPSLILFKEQCGGLGVIRCVYEKEI